MAKDLGPLKWVEDELPEGYLRKHMFGGFGYYLGPLIIMAIFENHGDKTYQGKVYPFEIWNGCLFPVEKENHPQLLKSYPFLTPHPVLSKWLYLPTDSEDFDSQLELIVKQIRRRSPLFGVLPKAKAKRGKRNKKAVSKVNPRKPQMFRS